MIQEQAATPSLSCGAHMHPSIANILNLKQPQPQPQQVSESNQGTSTPPPNLEDLPVLARTWDNHLFGNPKEPPQDDDKTSPCVSGTTCQALHQLGCSSVKPQQQPQHEEDDSAVLAAWTLLALGLLESAIRDRVMGCHTKTVGKAPLLSTMIRQLGNQPPPPQDKDNDQPHDETAQNSQEQEQEQEHKRLQPSLGSVLETLLLPKQGSGLNLRNLLWHGFCGSLPRPWFALVLHLYNQVQSESQRQPDTTPHHNKDNSPSVSSTDRNFRSSIPPGTTSDNPVSQKEEEWEYAATLQNEIALGALLRQPQHRMIMMETIAQWLPSSHASLWAVACDWMDRYPACATAVMTVLLEHGLRLDWCRVNQAPHHAMAHPGRYYVTLDGHGQRNQHNLLLHPHVLHTEDTLSNGPHNDDTTEPQQIPDPVPNALVQHLGSETMAFLSDLFCSASGPNIRAALGHGSWDGHVRRELQQMAHDSIHDKDKDKDKDNQSTNAIQPSDQQLAPVVSLLVLALYQTARMATAGSTATVSSSLVPRFVYQPKFSFAATTYRNLESMRHELQKLSTLVFATSNQRETTVDSSLDYLPSRPPSCADLDAHMELLMQRLEWSKEMIHELKLNQQLMELGAVRTLLADLVVACQSFSTSAQEALLLMTAAAAADPTANDTRTVGQGLTRQPNTRHYKKASRIVNLAPLALELYRFTLHVALVALDIALPPENDDNDDDQTKTSQACSNGTAMPVTRTSTPNKNNKNPSLLKAVERSRMVISTTSSFWTVNADRATKAIQDYGKGKAIKSFAAQSYPNSVSSKTKP